MDSSSATQKSIALYYSCHKKDRKLLEQLDRQLTVLRRQKLITTWHEGMIYAGERTRQDSIRYLEHAQIILILISADYIANDECYGQMEMAIQRYKNMETPVIPVLLSPIAGWELLPIAEMSPLPVGGRPVTRWSHQDEAFANIANGVRQIIERFITPVSHTQIGAKILKDIPPPSQHATILQRQSQIQNIYTQLMQSGTSAIILTGMGGIGKSTLAAQIYHHAEEIRHADKGSFKHEALWIHITPNMTINTLLMKLSDYATQHLEAQTPFELAVKLLQCLQEISRSRFIVIDQLEEWLDRQTGVILAEHTALGEWLNLLNGQACSSRILITSRLWPQGDHTYRQMYVQEIQTQGLEREEGVALLRLWNIQGGESDLQRAVDRCQGHALALTLLHKVLKNRHLTLTTMLNNPDYQQLWTRDIKILIQEIYKQLNETQHNLLLAFTIYREAVTCDAVYPIMKILHPVSISRNQVLDTLDALLGHGLLQIYAGRKERFALHPLVADFTRELLSAENGLVKEDVRCKAHSEAARYYQQQLIELSQSGSHRSSIQDVQESIEIAWHLCQAGQWQSSYAFMEREHLFTDLLRWGEHAILIA
jgi:NB-ARC domain/TIR domain